MSRLTVSVPAIGVSIALPNDRTGHIYVKDDIVYFDLVNAEGENIGHRMIEPEGFASLFEKVDA